MSGTDPITAAERRGRGIVMAIAFAIVTPPLFLAATVALRGYFPGNALLFRVGIAAIISWCLYKGYDWARRWVPIVFVLDALVTFAVLAAQGQWALLLRTLPIQGLAVAAAVAVWCSESVDLFLRRQSMRRRAILSLRGTGPE